MTTQELAKIQFFLKKQNILEKNITFSKLKTIYI